MLAFSNPITTHAFLLLCCVLLAAAARTCAGPASSAAPSRAARASSPIPQSPYVRGGQPCPLWLSGAARPTFPAPRPTTAHL